ncbi:ImmA/IrrE family metallo-endopeptidase [Sinomonas humi]|uniref:ImmA/IrrE family metallo-endopeptidase n=1 Tax=Sinomonas humi TaxID=1338436 RepID=UPI000689D154|nr:ImmA/IrrE family metallo-endopeptidase [Sinomonas humi]
MARSTTIDHQATRAAMAEQAASFIANPTGWPAAMAARALRLRAGHPAYSAGNQALIVCQLWARFEREGMDEHAAYDAAIRAAGLETAPAHVWRKRGYTPQSGALAIYSRPIQMWIDPQTGGKCDKDTPGAEQRRVFKVEQTYTAADVADEDGETAEQAHAAPELPEGEAREVFERIAAWITSLGWTVGRTARDMAEGGYTIHGTRQIAVHGALSEWAAVETLAHEAAHALLHGAEDDRPYAGDHRGDMEAEAEAVAFGLLTAFGQGDLARGSARYAAEWTRSPERVAVAYERASHVLDAVAAVAFGVEGVTVAESAKAAKAEAKAENKALAAALREAGLEPKGEAWQRAKAGEPIASIIAAMTQAAA